MKYTHYINIASAVLAVVLASCSAVDVPEPAAAGAEGEEIYLMADLATGEVSRVSYTYDGSVLKDNTGNFEASWQKGDYIKVYEIDAYYPTAADRASADTDIYSLSDPSDTYSARHPYPATPDVDRYYRFECVAGEGTHKGIFQYVGLATAKKRDDAATGSKVVDIELRRDKPICNWNKFQGIAVYENPLRQQLMGIQRASGDHVHIKYGQRMIGHVCAHNFQWASESSTTLNPNAGLAGLVMRNVDNCMFMIAIGGLDAPVYGGATISIDMPLTDPVTNLPVSTNTINVTIGSPDDFYFNKTLCEADPDHDHPSELAYNIVAYVNGCPGALAAGQDVVVTLTARNSMFPNGGTPIPDVVYTWHLSSPRDITFEQGRYYTFDLRDDQWTKN